MADDYSVRTAQDVVAPHADVVGEEAAKRAEDAGVVSPAYVDYPEALDNYQGRSDVETLAERRARENGSDFRDASFRREADAVANEGLVTTDTATAKDPSVVDEDKTEAKADENAS